MDYRSPGLDRPFGRLLVVGGLVVLIVAARMELGSRSAPTPRPPASHPTSPPARHGPAKKTLCRDPGAASTHRLKDTMTRNLTNDVETPQTEVCHLCNRAEELQGEIDRHVQDAERSRQRYIRLRLILGIATTLMSAGAAATLVPYNGASLAGAVLAAGAALVSGFTTLFAPERVAKDLKNREDDHAALLPAIRDLLDDLRDEDYARNPHARTVVRRLEQRHLKLDRTP
jgi:hypothetical protein